MLFKMIGTSICHMFVIATIISHVLAWHVKINRIREALEVVLNLRQGKFLEIFDPSSSFNLTDHASGNRNEKNLSKYQGKYD